MKSNKTKRFLDLLESELSGIIGLVLLLLVAGGFTLAGNLRTQETAGNETILDLGFTPKQTVGTAETAPVVFTVQNITAPQLTFGTIYQLNTIRISKTNAKIEGNYLSKANGLTTLGSTVTITIAFDAPITGTVYAKVAPVAGTSGGTVVVNGSFYKVQNSVPAQVVPITLSNDDALELKLSGSVQLYSISAASETGSNLILPAPVIARLLAAPSAATLEVGGSLALTFFGTTSDGKTVVVDPADLHLSTSNAEIAAVSPNGRITAQSAGVAFVNINHRNYEASTSVKVTVKEATAPATESVKQEAAPTPLESFLNKLKLPASAPVTEEPAAGSTKQEGATQPSAKTAPASAEEALAKAGQTFAKNLSASFKNFTQTIAQTVQKITGGASATPPAGGRPASPTVQPVTGSQPPATTPATAKPTISRKLSDLFKKIGQTIVGLIGGGQLDKPAPGAGATPLREEIGDEEAK